MTLLIKLAVVVMFTPIFLLPAVFIAVLGAYLGNVYIRAQLSIKREMSNAKAPVLGVFGSAVAGLSTLEPTVSHHTDSDKTTSVHPRLQCSRDIQESGPGSYRSLRPRCKVVLQRQSVRIFIANGLCQADAVHRWVSTRLDTFGQMFTAALAFYLVYGGVTDNASNIGFVINMAGTS